MIGRAIARWFLLSLALTALTALLASACGSSEERAVVIASEAAFVPVIESSDVFVGVPRLVLTLLERDTQPEFSEGTNFRIRYFEPTEGGVKFHSDRALNAIDVEGLRYFIADDPPFAVVGNWAIAVTAELPNGTAESSPRLLFAVRQTARGLTIGDPVPTIATPTISDGVLERMAEVSESDLGLYERSAAELLAAGEPFVIVWGSAERCAGRLACSRALRQAVESLREDDIAVLHVEPFGRPRRAELQALVDAANEAWSIEAEPQFYVVDAEGRVAARFEIVVETSELREAVEAVLR